MIELQKFIDELEAEKQKADKTANFWEGHDKGRQEYYIGVSDSLLLAIDKARLLLKRHESNNLNTSPIAQTPL